MVPMRRTQIRQWFDLRGITVRRTDQLHRVLEIEKGIAPHISCHIALPLVSVFGQQHRLVASAINIPARVMEALVGFQFENRTTPAPSSCKWICRLCLRVRPSDVGVKPVLECSIGFKFDRHTHESQPRVTENPRTFKILKRLIDQPSVQTITLLEGASRVSRGIRDVLDRDRGCRLVVIPRTAGADQNCDHQDAVSHRTTYHVEQLIPQGSESPVPASRRSFHSLCDSWSPVMISKPRSSTIWKSSSGGWPFVVR